jgi:predicted DNA-binding transcriptional regulator AlpA
LSNRPRLSGKSGTQSQAKDKESDTLFADLVRAVASVIMREQPLLTRNTSYLSLEPLGLNRVQAAAYVGVSPSLFDEMVSDGRMPQPKAINSRVVWNRKQLEEAFEALPRKDEANPWDKAQEAA